MVCNQRHPLEAPSPYNHRRTIATEIQALRDVLFPAGQSRIVRLLVGRMDLAPDGMQVRLRAEGLQTLVEDFAGARGQSGMRV